ncbi:hypothetical protein ACHQM5_007954 [Ranunculus cassubicifolius]
MYGDCQVLSSMGGGNVSSDSLFTSPIRNPNLNFMTNLPPFHHQPSFSSLVPKEEAALQMGGNKEDDIESRSGSGNADGGSADEQDLEEQQAKKKKRYHRHTARQIQEMEALFKECPHPDDKQRMKLSQDLGLKPRQVKFWFQNRRTQLKAQQDRSENVILRTENETLKNENFRLQAALRSIDCPNCGGPAALREMSYDEQHLRIENARLKEELDRLACVMPRYGMRQMSALGPPPPLLLPSVDLDMNIYPRHFQEQMGACTDMVPLPSLQDHSNLAACNMILEQDKDVAMQMAMRAVEELVKMCHMNEPLWLKSGNANKEMLNMEEYEKMFSWPASFKQQRGAFRTEATRDSAVVIMNSINLAGAFLDANKWVELFPSIVAKAKIVQIITSGVSGHASGSLHLMHADLQVLSPLVPVRETYFLRYCQQNAEEGTWAIVDFPIDAFHNPLQYSFPRYQRRPSGCIIQDMPNGYSRVSWVEHAVVEDKPVHSIFNQLVNTGSAFGAQRWLAVMQQQCERLASLMAKNGSDVGVMSSPEAKKNLMQLTQRMIRTFCYNMGASGGQQWTSLSESPEDTVRITTRKNTMPGQPNGLILCATSTNWLPFPHHQVFDLLRDERRRSQLDVLCNGTSSEEVVHIANGAHPGNCISLFRINTSSNSSHNMELMLQESSTDQFSSLIVYSIIDVGSVNLTVSGADPSYIPLLPLGFHITPMSNNDGNFGSPNQENGLNSGCLLTVGVQSLASPIPSAKINLTNITTINNHILSVVHQINSALSDQLHPK